MICKGHAAVRRAVSLQQSDSATDCFQSERVRAADCAAGARVIRVNHLCSQSADDASASSRDLLLLLLLWRPHRTKDSCRLQLCQRRASVTHDVLLSLLATDTPLAISIRKLLDS